MGPRTTAAAEAGTLRRLLEHDAWATRAVLEACRPLSAEQFARRFDIGPGSLHDTLLHVVGAMRRWADRIARRPLRPHLEGDGMARTPDQIIEVLDQAAADLEALALGVAAAGRLEERIEVRLLPRNERFEPTLGTALVHVLTHGSHHRAQALNMLRRLGVAELPRIDPIAWEAEAGARPAG